MNYESIADIYNTNDRIRSSLTSRVATLSAAQQTFRPAGDAWSVADIIEHLSITEQNMVRLIGLLLAKTESAATTAASNAGDDADHQGAAAAAAATSPAAAPVFQPFSMEALAEKVRDVKLNAPEQIRPTGQSLAESLVSLQETRAAIENMRPRLEAADLTFATYPHPAWGEINLAQWLAFIGLHEGRHLQQVKRLMDAPDFASASAS